MLRFIYANDLKAFPRLAHTMFTDRTRQFRDRLGWPVTVDTNGEERDEYDGFNPLYVIWENPDLTHGGSMRLLPTVGPSMVNDHFADLTDGARIESPLIWECTRYCLSSDASAVVAAALMLGGGHVMREFGVEHFVGVFSAPMVRVYRALGASPDILGTRGSGREAISVGLWEHTPVAERALAQRAGVSPAMIAHWFDRCLGTKTPHRQETCKVRTPALL